MAVDGPPPPDPARQRLSPDWDSTLPVELPDKPSNLAAAAQSASPWTGRYEGVDPDWRDTPLPAGTRVWILLPEDVLSQDGAIAEEKVLDPERIAEYVTGFTVAEGDLDDGVRALVDNARELNEAGQIAAYNGTYKGYLACFEVTEETAAAIGTATANKSNGFGGLTQTFIPDAEAAILNGDLIFVNGRHLDPTTLIPRPSYQK